MVMLGGSSAFLLGIIPWNSFIVVSVLMKYIVRRGSLGVVSWDL